MLHQGVKARLAARQEPQNLSTLKAAKEEDLPFRKKGFAAKAVTATDILTEEGKVSTCQIRAFESKEETLEEIAKEGSSFYLGKSFFCQLLNITVLSKYD